MIEQNIIKREFEKYGGILKTSELSTLGLSSRQIKKLLDHGVISKIKFGYYELNDYITKEEVIIARIFPHAVIYLKSALLYYGYTDRVPLTWQIAVDKDSEKSQYKLDYPFIQPFFIESKFIKLGITTYEADGIIVNIYDRDRTICDVLRYEKKLDKEVFNKAIQNYIKDNKKNIGKLIEYSNILNIKGKVHTYIGVWL